MPGKHDGRLFAFHHPPKMCKNALTQNSSALVSEIIQAYIISNIYVGHLSYNRIMRMAIQIL